MTIMKKFFIASLVSLLGVPLMGAPAHAGDSRCWEPRGGEQGFTYLMNEARGAHRAPKLSLDPELSRAARVHTREMVSSDILHHTPEPQLRTRVTNWVILGENVGVGATVPTLHKAFMDSVLHRANVLNGSFRHVGVGTLRSEGRLWVTIIFEGESDPGTPLRMPSC